MATLKDLVDKIRGVLTEVERDTSTEVREASKVRTVDANDTKPFPIRTATNVSEVLQIRTATVGVDDGGGDYTDASKELSPVRLVLDDVGDLTWNKAVVKAVLDDVGDWNKAAVKATVRRQLNARIFPVKILGQELNRAQASKLLDELNS